MERLICPCWVDTAMPSPDELLLQFLTYMRVSGLSFASPSNFVYFDVYQQFNDRCTPINRQFNFWGAASTKFDVGLYENKSRRNAAGYSSRSVRRLSTPTSNGSAAPMSMRQHLDMSSHCNVIGLRQTSPALNAHHIFHRTTTSHTWNHRKIRHKFM